MSATESGAGEREFVPCWRAECQRGCYYPTVCSEQRAAEPSATPDTDDARANETDVEALAWMIHRACGCGPMDHGEGPICPPDREDYDGARNILASDWLAARVSAAATRARAEGAAEALRQAADDLTQVGLPSPTRAEVTTWLRDRAARIARSES